MVATGLIVAGVATFYHARVAHDLRGRNAAASFEAIMAALDQDVFHTRRPGIGVLREKGDVTRTLRATLKRYHVLGEGDWREFSEFADLPPAVRADTEAFLLEQAYRFAGCLAGVPMPPTTGARDCLPWSGWKPIGSPRFSRN